VPLETIFFDFGGTLATSDPTLTPPSRAWAHVAAGMGFELSEPRIAEAMRVVDSRFEGRIYAYLGRTGEFWKLYDAAIFDQLELVDRRAELAEALDRFFNDPARVLLYPETRGVLEQLREDGFSLGVISNYHDGLLRVLRYHRLDLLLAPVVFSQAVGAEKPDPRIFAHALAAAGRRPDEALHVGDSYEADYLGATRSGLRAVWLNRHGETSPTDCPEIRDLRGLPALIGPGPARHARDGQPDFSSAR